MTLFFFEIGRPPHFWVKRRGHHFWKLGKNKNTKILTNNAAQATKNILEQEK